MIDLSKNSQMKKLIELNEKLQVADMNDGTNLSQQVIKKIEKLAEKDGFTVQWPGIHPLFKKV